MAEFLTTAGLTSAIETVIRKANDKVTIISPYIKISKTYYERLVEAEKRKVGITIVFGKEDLQEDQDDLLGGFDNLLLYFCDNLHAKCYMNEDTAIIASMNLYEYSQVNNREMGVLVKRNEDGSLYKDIIQEVDSIIRKSDRLYKVENTKKSKHLQSNNGTCIRCGCEIELNPGAPYCRSCYKDWNKYGNVFYEEKYCHICGRLERTTVEKPMCYQCYKEYN